MSLDTVVQPLETTLRRHIINARMYLLLVILFDKFMKFDLSIFQRVVLSLAHVAAIFHGLK